MASANSGIRKRVNRQPHPSTNLHKRGFEFEIQSGAKAVNALGNDEERFKCTDVMHLEVLRSLRLMEIGNAWPDSSEFAARHAVW